MSVSPFLLRALAFAFVWTLLRSGADVLAQGYPSEQERFTVNQIRGCAPLDVAVLQEDEDQLAGNTSPRIYKFNYDGNLSRVFVNEDQTSKDTTYAIPGTYKILQVVGDMLDSITIEVLEPRPPQFRVYNCINNGIYLEINDDYYDRLQIDFGDASSTVDVATGQPFVLHNYNVAGEYTVTVQGIFDDASSENCAVADTTITTIDALTVADLTAVAVESGSAVRVSYQLPNPNVSYRLEVAEAGSTEFSFARFDMDDSGELVIDDPVFRTREQSYCFRIAAVNRCDESQNLVSETVCSIALQGEAQDLQNQLTWTSEGFTRYNVIRDGNTVATTADSEYLDTNVKCQQVYQYQVTAESEAGTSSSEFITLTARSEAVPPAPDSVGVQVPGQLLRVVWRLAPEATQYFVYRGTDGQTPVLYDSISTQDSVAVPRAYEDTNVEVAIAYCYQVSYRDVCGNESALSEPACATLPTQGELYFPNAFTPNGDGINDVFSYKSRLIEQVEMHIYNRWGELLFWTNQLDVGWDGSYQGIVAPQGTYLYKVQVVDQLGNRFTRQGSFVLLDR